VKGESHDKGNQVEKGRGKGRGQALPRMEELLAQLLEKLLPPEVVPLRRASVQFEITHFEKGAEASSLCREEILS